MLHEAIFVGVRHPNLFQHSSSDNKWLSIISHPPIRKKLSLICCNDLHSLKKERKKTEAGVYSSDNSGPEPEITNNLHQCDSTPCPSVAPFPSSCRLPILRGTDTHTTDTHTHAHTIDTHRFYLKTNTWVEGRGAPLHSTVNTFLHFPSSE